jgi:hypothetical protein
MTEVMQGPKSDAQRIADRLKPSAGSPDTATSQMTQGAGTVNRIITTIHRGSSQSQHGPVDPGVGDISGGKR